MTEESSLYEDLGLQECKRMAFIKGRLVELDYQIEQLNIKRHFMIKSGFLPNSHEIFSSVERPIQVVRDRRDKIVDGFLKEIKLELI